MKKKKGVNKQLKNLLPLFSCCYGTSRLQSVWSAQLLSQDHCLLDVAFTKEDVVLFAIALCSQGTDSPARTPVSHHVSRLEQN